MYLKCEMYMLATDFSLSVALGSHKGKIQNNGCKSVGLLFNFFVWIHFIARFIKKGAFGHKMSEPIEVRNSFPLINLHILLDSITQDLRL